MAEIFKCPACGAPLEIQDPNQGTIACPYCSQSVIVPEEIRQSAQQPGIYHLDGSPAPVTDNVQDLIKQAVQLGQVVRLVREGKKIDAIKAYRGFTGVGLAESKTAVERIEAGQKVQFIPTQAAGAVNDDLRSEIEGFLRQNRKIDAIKAYRKATTASLVEAKNAVEQIQASQKVQFIPTPDDGTINVDLRSEIVWLLRQNRKIDAIKAYRKATTASLVEAKNAVEQIEANLGTEIPSKTRGVTIDLDQSVAGSKSTGCSMFIGGIALVVLSVAAVAISIIFQTAGKSPTLPIPVGFITQVSSFGSKGIGQGSFQDARLIAVDGDGDIFVGEYQGGRVQVFDPSGKFISQWTADPKMPMRGMAVGHDGALYITQKGEIQRYDGMTGKLLGKVAFPENYGFDDVAATADGGLAAFWYANEDDLVRFDRSGAVQFVVKNAISTQTGDPELEARVAVDGLGNFYMLGVFSNAVFKFDPSGKFLNRFGSEGNENGQFRAPDAIAVDSQGRIYVSDIKGIQVFGPDGRYLDVFKVQGAAFGMTCDNQGNLFVVTNAQKVFKFHINGKG